MATKFISMRNLKFLIYEVFDVLALTKHDYYSQHNRKMFDMVISEARNLGIKEIYPTYKEGDREGVKFENGEVIVPDFLPTHRLSD